MDTFRHIVSSNNALAAFSLVILSVALILSFSGGPLALTILLYVVALVFGAAWWLITKDSG